MASINPPPLCVVVQVRAYDPHTIKPLLKPVYQVLDAQENKYQIILFIPISQRSKYLEILSLLMALDTQQPQIPHSSLLSKCHT
jgi:hypothetical protein